MLKEEFRRYGRIIYNEMLERLGKGGKHLSHDFVQLIGALTTAAGFLISLYTALTSNISVVAIIVFIVGILLLVLSRWLAKRDLARRRKASRYLSNLDKKKAEEAQKQQQENNGQQE
ncbi:MAG TPA: hypothetical protein PLN81_04825 [Bacillota bacterium]|jgi:uncharacterized membrane protein|nr:hypothetical protein [Bacillota bacterium]